MTNNNAMEHLDAGRAALRAAEWERAQNEFQAALAQADSPEAHDGLGLALWWLNDIRASHSHRARAYVGYKQRGDLKRAAMLALWLGREQVFLSANGNAMKGWFARAERHLEQAGQCTEHAWFRLLRDSMLAPPAVMQTTATETLEIARAANDVDLEAMALAFGGIARVVQGQVARGMAHLDEAMAAATSGEINFTYVSEIFCLMLSACDVAGDLGRTEQWCRTAQEFAAQNHFPFLAATCRTMYGSFLTAAGRWSDAETELLEAIRSFEAGHYALRTQAVLKLADLRVCQGRLEEAEVLLAGFEDQGVAIVPLARLYLARGKPKLARAVIEQALQVSTTRTLDAAPLLRLAVDVQLALSDLDGAKSAAAQLADLAREAQSDLLFAQADLAQGQVKRVTGSPDAANYFQSALERLRSYDQSMLGGRVRLEMARLLQDSDRAGAITWARAALASFERIGAAQDAQSASALLRQWRAVDYVPPSHQDALTPRETQVFRLLAQGLTNREIAEKLVVSPKTIEHHVSQILAKLGAHTRAEAAAMAARKHGGSR